MRCRIADAYNREHGLLIDVIPLQPEERACIASGSEAAAGLMTDACSAKPSQTVPVKTTDSSGQT